MIKVNLSLNIGGQFKPVSSHTLHEKRITVGRDNACTLTLEDTQKHVSRMHVELEEADGAYWMKVVSKVNPVIVNGKRYLSHDRVALAKGDQISVGLYKIEVVTVESAPPPPKVEPPKRLPEKPEDITYIARPGMPLPTRTPPQPSLPETPEDKEETTYVPSPRTPVSEAPVLNAQASQAPPPLSVLPENAAQAEEATYVPATKTPATKTPTPEPLVEKAPAPHLLPPEPDEADDEVTYIQPIAARPSRRSSLMPAPSAQEEEGVSEDLTSIRRPTVKISDPPDRVEPSALPDLDLDLSEAFDSLKDSEPVPKELVIAAKELVTAAKEPVTAAKEPVTAANKPETAERPATGGPAGVPDPDIEEGFSDDRTYVRRPIPRPLPPKSPTQTHVAPPPTPVAPVSVKSARLPAGPGADRAVQAFLEGAGLADLQVPDAEAFMRESGVMVRAAVEGIVMLLLAHEEARRQLGAEPESVAGDNPLKSMADPAEVIAFLFDPRRPAIADADPVKAFEAACSDLRAHQVALFTGMRAAVISALRSLDPKKIEREHGVSLGGLNLTRKSKLWDIAVAQYDTLAREMEADFSKVFGHEILAAYTAQVHKIKGGR